MIDALKKIFRRKKMQTIPLARSYQAAAVNRLTSSFASSTQSVNQAIRPALSVLRARSRNLYENNVYARKFFKNLSVNVVGPDGIRLQSEVKNEKGDFDLAANQAIETAWKDWSAEGICEVTGVLAFVEALNLIVESLAREGEILIRKVHGWSGNKNRFALQLIEADHLDDQFHDNRLASGNRIDMGVETNEYGRPVAYHILREHPGEYMSTLRTQSRDRVPAEQIIHVFVTERVGQRRGVPWLFAAMLELNNLGAYREAAIINARMGAAKMGFYKAMDLAAIADGEDSQTGEFVQDADPGHFSKLPPGYDFVEYNPDYPRAEFDPFNKALLRGIASGVLASYSSISGDLSDVNFSSLRSGKIDERDVYKVIQKFIIRKVLNRLYPDWLFDSLLNSAVTFPSGSSLPVTKFKKFNAPRWQPRGFDWVDPSKDIKADIDAINARLKTRQEVAAARGMDLREIFAQLAEEERLAEQYGLTPAPVAAAPASGGSQDNTDGGDEDGASDGTDSNDD